MLKGCSNLNKKDFDDKNKMRRKVLRGKKMNTKDKLVEKEGELYEPGGF